MRAKLLSRKMGYGPQHTTSQLPAHLAEASRALPRPQDTAALLAAVVRAPGGLGSTQHRAVLDSTIDAHLDQLVRRPWAACTLLSCTLAVQQL